MITCRIDNRIDRLGTQLVLRKKIGGDYYVWVEDEWKILERGFESNFKPTIFVRDNEEKEMFQVILDALISKGYRPSQVKLNDKELEATQYHLEDMRKLVFKEKK